MSEKITLHSFFDEQSLSKSLIIQNVLGGALVLSDLDDLVIESGGTYVFDLNADDERRLRRSNSLRCAMRNNLVRQLTAEQYDRELEIEDLRAQDEDARHEAEMTMIDINDDIALNAEKIDFTREARRAASGGQKRKAISQELKTDPIRYAKLQAQLREQNPDLSPHDFAQMVDENSTSLQRMAMADDHGHGRATVARPDGRGGTYAESYEMGNFQRDGQLRGFEQSPRGYTHKGYRETNPEYDYSDDFAEEIDLASDSDTGSPRGFARI